MWWKFKWFIGHRRSIVNISFKPSDYHPTTGNSERKASNSKWIFRVSDPNPISTKTRSDNLPEWAPFNTHPNPTVGPAPTARNPCPSPRTLSLSLSLRCPFPTAGARRSFPPIIEAAEIVISRFHFHGWLAWPPRPWFWTPSKGKVCTDGPAGRIQPIPLWIHLRRRLRRPSSLLSVPISSIIRLLEGLVFACLW